MRKLIGRLYGATIALGIAAVAIAQVYHLGHSDGERSGKSEALYEIGNTAHAAYSACPSGIRCMDTRAASLEISNFAEMRLAAMDDPRP